MELTSEEKAYFDSRGESEPPVTEGPGPEVEAEVADNPNPEPASATTDAPAADDKPAPRTVPLPELIAERKERQRLQQEVAEYQRRLQEFEQRTAPKDDAPKPDYDNDPVAALKMTAAEVAELRKFREGIEAQERERQQLREWSDWAGSQERQFSASTPDYNDATNFLRESRAAELREMGHTQQQVDYYLNMDALSIAQIARNSGRNPAEMLYALAKSRGYSAAPPAAKSVEPERKIAQIADGQARAKSLGSASGSTQGSKTTAEALLEMTDEEFAAATSGGKWRRAVKGM